MPFASPHLRSSVSICGCFVSQFLAGFLESHEDARLVELPRAPYDKLHREQRLAAAGRTADQRGPALRQAALVDFVQAADASRRLRQ
jgi:hypothetical protein